MLKEIRSVTSFLEYRGEILILLRSDRVRSYKGIWGGVSGRIQNERTPLEQAELEVEEETGLSGEEILSVKAGEVMEFDDSEIKIKKVVYPFLFQIKDPNKVVIDWEHTRCKWIKPFEIDEYVTMPKLKEAMLRVLKNSG
jgi:8-oxo-dGTP diphosphatase